MLLLMLLKKYRINNQDANHQKSLKNVLERNQRKRLEDRKMKIEIKIANNEFTKLPRFNAKVQIIIIK